MKSLHWTTQLELALADPNALRVLDKLSIVQLANDARPGVSEPTVERWIQEAVSANRLQRVVRGLYLNNLISPPARLAEAAVWLRPGAIVSLQTVLGDSGVWNNFTPWVTAIVPLAKRYTTPSLGRLDTTGGTFLFRGNARVDIGGGPRIRPAGTQRHISPRDFRSGAAALALFLRIPAQRHVISTS